MTKSIKNYIENFKKYKFLLKELVVNDIKIKYQRSVLGILWSVLHPLMIMVVLTAVFSALFKSDIENFAVYVLTGRVIWDLYSQATIFAQGSIVDNAGLIKKVYVPKYIFPISKCFTALVNCCFATAALLLVMVVTGMRLTPVLLLMPIAIFYTVIFAIGVGLILSTVTVFFRDMIYLYEVLMTAWMYFTPIFYPANILPQKFSWVMKVNPLYYFVEYFREIIFEAQFPDIKTNILCFSIGSIAFIVGLFVFYKKQDKFILYV